MVGTCDRYLPLQMCYPDLWRPVPFRNSDLWVTWPVGDSDSCSPLSWSQLRWRFCPGFEDILEMGLVQGWYDPSDTLDRYVHCMILISFCTLCLKFHIFFAGYLSHGCKKNSMHTVTRSTTQWNMQTETRCSLMVYQTIRMSTHKITMQ